MWVLMEASLRGFPFTITVATVPPSPNPVLVTKGEISDIELLLSNRSVSRVNPARGEMSDMELL